MLGDNIKQILRVDWLKTLDQHTQKKPILFHDHEWNQLENKAGRNFKGVFDQLLSKVSQE